LKLDHGGDRRVNTRKLITLAEFTVLNALDCNERRANAFEAGPCLEKFSAQPERIGREQIGVGWIVLGVDRPRYGHDIYLVRSRDVYGMTPRLELSPLQIFDATRHSDVIKLLR